MDEFERERWRGEIDSELKGIKEKLKVVEAEIRAAEKAMRDIEIKVQTLATKLGFYSAIGAMAGGGIVSVVVGLFFKH